MGHIVKGCGPVAFAMKDLHGRIDNHLFSQAFILALESFTLNHSLSLMINFTLDID
jgi:hypothetical protein